MKIGILGGGQLGKMLYAAANQLGLEITFMDSMADGPTAKVSREYTVGTITDKEDVVAFGSDVDIVSIEIEKVSIEGLTALKEAGKAVYPQPEIIATIQDKGLQKVFYRDHKLPSARFKTYDNLDDSSFNR